MRRLFRRRSEKLRPVLFHVLADWRREDIKAERVARGEPDGGVAIERFVWIAFAARVVSVGEYDGKDAHQGKYSPDRALEIWRDGIDEPPARWLLPYLERYARGEDVQQDVLAAYAAEHDGASPRTVMWETVV